MKFEKIVLSFIMIFTILLSIKISTTEAAAPFKDVPNNYWAKKEIDFLVSKGIITGNSNGTFQPGANVKRIDAAIILTKGMNIKTDNALINATDLSKGTDGYKAVAALVRENIISNDKKFRPNEIITKNELATILYKGFSISGSYKGTIKDVNKNSSSFAVASSLLANGIMSVDKSGKFNPNEKITKASISSYLFKSIKYTPKQTGSVKGNITWQYNKYIGTKPDVGAAVILIPKRNLSVKTDELFLSKISGSNANLKLYSAKVDGFGSYEISNVPAGKYYAILISSKTFRNFNEPIDEYYLEILNQYISDFKSNSLLGIHLYKHAITTIEIIENKSVIISKDWGYTYI